MAVDVSGRAEVVVVASREVLPDERYHRATATERQVRRRDHRDSVAALRGGRGRLSRDSKTCVHDSQRHARSELGTLAQRRGPSYPRRRRRRAPRRNFAESLMLPDVPEQAPGAFAQVGDLMHSIATILRASFAPSTMFGESALRVPAATKACGHVHLSVRPGKVNHLN